MATQCILSFLLPRGAPKLSPESLLPTPQGASKEGAPSSGSCNEREPTGLGQGSTGRACRPLGMRPPSSPCLAEGPEQLSTPLPPSFQGFQWPQAHSEPGPAFVQIPTNVFLPWAPGWGFGGLPRGQGLGLREVLAPQGPWRPQAWASPDFESPSCKPAHYPRSGSCVSAWK